MNLAQLSWLSFGLGLATLAGLLYWLHRLRTRHREQPVPTLLFWRIAAEDGPARTLAKRFRHPWIYALLLLICALLWLAFGDPRLPEKGAATLEVAVLDGSAVLAAPGRFAEASAALRAQVRALPAGKRQVLWCGAETLTLLAPGEHELLLDERLASLRPEAVPNRVGELLASLAREASPEHPLHVTVFGDAPASEASAPGLRVTRALLKLKASDANRGIAALGLAAARSGAWSEVDAYVEIAASEGLPEGTPAPIFLLSGKPLPAGRVERLPSPGRARYYLSGLPAEGQLLEVSLAGQDALPLGKVARVRLPNRPRIRVLLSPSLEELRDVLASDPAVELVRERGAVAVRREGEAFGENLPALEFVGGTDTAAFEIVHPETVDERGVLREAVESVGLREVDASALADKAGRPVEVSLASGPQWRIRVWSDLLTPDYNFTRSRAFPLFVANSLRWLARAELGAPYVAAGKPLRLPLSESKALPLGAQGRALDTLGDVYAPARAGELRLSGRAEPLAVSLLVSPHANEAVPSLPQTPSGALPTAAPRPALWLLLGAFALLLLEWHLHRKGRAP